MFRPRSTLAETPRSDSGKSGVHDAYSIYRREIWTTTDRVGHGRLRSLELRMRISVTLPGDTEAERPRLLETVSRAGAWPDFRRGGMAEWSMAVVLKTTLVHVSADPTSLVRVGD